MNRSMLRPIAILWLITLAISPPAYATPRIDLHWQTCTGNLNRGIGEGSPDIVVVTASGLSGLVSGAQFLISFGLWGATLSDAWRYDATGCEAGRMSVRQVPAGTACPVLNGAMSSSSFDFQYPTPFRIRADLKFSVGFQPIVADPAKTYTIAQFVFEHGNVFIGPGVRPDSCGCLERPLCIALRDYKYFDGAFQEKTLGAGNDFLTWNDPGNRSLCPSGPDLCDEPCDVNPDTLCTAQPTPASARSWGSVKATYR